MTPCNLASKLAGMKIAKGVSITPTLLKQALEKAERQNLSFSAYVAGLVASDVGLAVDFAEGESPCAKAAQPPQTEAGK